MRAYYVRAYLADGELDWQDTIHANDLLEAIRNFARDYTQSILMADIVKVEVKQVLEKRRY